MGLSASMYAGVSGLKAHGEKMGVVGNNIANVNTIGFKGARMYFEDVISQDIPTAAGIGQVGRGVGIGAIYADFKQGSLETTGEATDLAIGGNGFFIVKKKNEDTQYYTRAGNFRFDKDGYLTDPNGLVLQGWAVERTNPALAVSGAMIDPTHVRIVGTPTDIRMDSFQSPPQETTNVSVIANLNSAEPSRTQDPAHPLTSLYGVWDGQANPPLTEAQYSYQSTIKVFDENGTAHDLTVYFDQVDVSDAGGKKVWEYIVTVPPGEDGRTDLLTSTARGVLMMGTMTFGAAGEMENMTAYTLKDPAVTPWADSDPADRANWTLADFSQSGYPVMTANFLGKPGLSYTDSPQNADNIGPSLIELNLGMKNNPGAGWNPPAGSAVDLGITTLDPITGDPVPVTGSDISTMVPKMADGRPQASATTSFNTGSATLFQTQDGYAAGLLLGITVDRDGVLSGRYSNGQIEELFVVTLADFNNRWGLRREGSNLFQETRDSGAAITNRPNTAGKGSITSNAIEQSNVDLADEFVQMITTQRGFQANGKIVTTVDTMLGEVINLKRM